MPPGSAYLSDVFTTPANLTGLPGPCYRTTDQLYLKPRARMEALFGDRPGALRNAAAVAERCAGAVDLGGEIHVPSARLSGGETARGKLARLALRGARERYGHVEGRVRAGWIGTPFACVAAIHGYRGDDTESTRWLQLAADATEGSPSCRDLPVAEMGPLRMRQVR